MPVEFLAIGATKDDIHSARGDDVLEDAIEFDGDATLAIIGGGPAASSLLERIAANAQQLLDGRSLRVHLIDPHRAGTGRGQLRFAVQRRHL